MAEEIKHTRYDRYVRHKARSVDFRGYDMLPWYTADPKSLCCGFVKVNHSLYNGAQFSLKGQRYALPVTIVQNVEPHLRGRKPIQSMLQLKD